MILASAHPYSVLLSVASALAYAVPTLRRGTADGLSRGLLLAGWLLHAGALASGLLMGNPRFGFASALSVTAWLVLSVYVVESRFFPALQGQGVLAGLCALAVLLPLPFPGAPLHVTASAWLPLHLALGVACYGLFAAAVAHAALMTRAERRMREVSAAATSEGLPLLTLERLTFRFVTAGFVLLSATLLAGWWFGDQLYGQTGAGAGAAAAHRWVWDHKTVFSVLAWCTFAALLLGRSRFGWRGPAAVRVLYVGAGLLLLSYIGSRFVLEVILGRSP